MGEKAQPDQQQSPIQGGTLPSPIKRKLIV